MSKNKYTNFRNNRSTLLISGVFVLSISSPLFAQSTQQKQLTQLRQIKQQEELQTQHQADLVSIALYTSIFIAFALGFHKGGQR